MRERRYTINCYRCGREIPRLFRTRRRRLCMACWGGADPAADYEEFRRLADEYQKGG